MRGKTHCTIGILAVIQASILFKIPVSIFNIFVSAIFSLLPDLDEPGSILSDFFFKKNISKFIYKILIHSINIIIFFVSLKINDNFYLSSLITFTSIILIETKLTHAVLRKLFLTLIFVLLAVCLYLIKTNFYVILFVLILSIFPWLKHRSFSHSILSIIMIYFVLKQIELLYNISNLCFFGTLSYASHIFIGDLFTKQGVPLFYPISDKKISLGFIKVGSFLGDFFEIISIVALFALIVFSLIKGF